MYTCVADIPTDFELVTRDVVIDSILKEDLKTEYTYIDYGALFTLEDNDGNYIAVYGIEGIIPYMHTRVDLILDRRFQDGAANQDQPGQPSLFGG
jgi:hypothetical protein